MDVHKFEEIRSYNDQEVSGALNRLMNDQPFCAILGQLFTPQDYRLFFDKMKTLTTVRDFQHQIIHPVVRNYLADKTTKSLDISGFKFLDKQQAYTFISNHRDIVLDSAFLNILLIEKGLETFEIAIGDNLLIKPWIKDLVRLNKSFIVKRNLPVRQQLLSSIDLSSYIYNTLLERKQSVWLAQREGRSKNADDRTQDSLLKMLNLGGNSSVLQNLSSIQIVPVSISYEYDPCDYLKAKEMQQKRDNPAFQKTVQDDLLNMQTGLLGYKGRVFFKVTPCISDEILKIDTGMHKNELFVSVSKLIDHRIHMNYHLYPGNYVAADLLDGFDTFSHLYSVKEKEQFTDYLKQQLDKIELENKDEAFLKERILEMYANPLKNKLNAETSI